MVQFLWLPLIGIFGVLSFVWIYAKNILKWRHLNTHFTPDRELNSLVYRMPSYVIIYRSYILSKIVRFFGPPCIKPNVTWWRVGQSCSPVTPRDQRDCRYAITRFSLRVDSEADTRTDRDRICRKANNRVDGKTGETLLRQINQAMRGRLWLTSGRATED